MGDRRTVSNLRRSASTSMRTPQHRPSYTSRPSRSPGTRTPLSVAGVTSNSEQHRRQVGENAAKVMEFLQTDRTFFNRMNLGKAGLKSMTSNQFIEIITFFMMKIAGKNLLSKNPSHTHDDVIMKFAQDLKYPYAINKACFKSPNSHHFFPEVVAILAFVSDVIGDIRKCTGSMKMPLKPCDRLLNAEFTQLFSAEMLSSYLQYDPDHVSLLDNDSETLMINRFIAIKLKLNAPITVDELAAKTLKLQQSNEQLCDNLTETDVQKCFNSVHEQMMAQETELQHLQEVLNDKRTHLKMITLKHTERATELRAKQTECTSLIEKIQNQMYSTLDIKQLMAKETTIKSSIAMIRGEVDAIKAQMADCLVKLARAQKLKFDMIKQFNQFTFDITSKLMESSTFRQKINVNDLTIDPAASMADVQKVCMHLKLLGESCAAVKRQYRQKIQQNNENMTECSAELEQLTDKYSADMTTFQMATTKLNEAQQQCENYKCDRSTDENRLRCAIDDLIAYKNEMMKEIDSLRSRAIKLKAENVALLNMGEQKSREAIRAKQTGIKQMDQLCDFIDDIIGDDDEDDNNDNAWNNVNQYTERHGMAN